MKLLSFVMLSALLSITACSHTKKDCKDKESCSKEAKACCKEKKDCKDEKCAKDMKPEVKKEIKKEVKTIKKKS